MNDYSDINAERCDWVGIDEKIDMDKDGKVGEDPPGDMNGDGYPGEAGTDDDNDGLTDEDSHGRQPGEPGYTNDLMEDDDEDGRIEDGEIVGLNEDPGGFDNKWDHIIMIRNYTWRNPEEPGNEPYKMTFGHKYNFIHASDHFDKVIEDTDEGQFYFPLRHTQYYQLGDGKVWNIYFRSPNRP